MRCLIIGCGCRGRLLARALLSAGHAVRGTSRDASRRQALAADGGEPYDGDPGRIGTLIPALDQVGVVYVLLGSAEGSRDELRSLHRERLGALLEKLIDTTVKAVAYEAAGTVDGALLRDGAQLVRTACKRSAIPYALIQANPADRERWLVDALGSLAELGG